MSIVLTHPTGNEFFRAAARGFFKTGKLQSIYTTVASFPDSWLYKLGSFKFFSEVRRRSLDKNFRSIIHTYPFKETARLLAIKLKQGKLIRHETGIFSVDAVYNSLDKHVAHNLKQEQAKGASVLYAYEDGAAYSFREAKKLGIKKVYDLPIGYWRDMHATLSLEKELNPHWAGTLEGLKNSENKLNRKDEEIALADSIIAASSFTAKSLQDYKGTLPEIKIIPYGFPPVYPKQYRSIKQGDKIKLLFVGGLSQRKGLSYLFDALNGFESAISLTIIGKGNFNNSPVIKDNLAKHIWIPTLSHQKVLEQMQLHDILIFPSLYEGFGQVITEAMAQGTPVITTERTAGPDLIDHGKNGWLVKAGSVNMIKSLLEDIVQYPSKIEQTGQLAAKTAAKRPWEVYSKELSEFVCNIN